MSINVSGLPPYSEQISKKPISKTIAGARLIDKVKKEKLLKYANTKTKGK